MQDPKTAGFDVAVNLSKQTIGTSHPAALRLDRAGRSGCAPSTYSNDQGQQWRGVRGPGGSIGGKTAGALRFGLILIGLIGH